VDGWVRGLPPDMLGVGWLAVGGGVKEPAQKPGEYLKGKGERINVILGMWCHSVFGIPRSLPTTRHGSDEHNRTRWNETIIELAIR